MNSYEKLSLTPIEQRYIATCYPLHDRPFIEEAIFWKMTLRESVKTGQDIQIPAIEIYKAFPHIGRLYLEGFFNRRTLQEYFEGLDNESHNMRMYLFARRISRKASPDIIADVMEHVNGCSVKVADLETDEMHSYGTVQRVSIDANYFGSSITGRYVFVHGREEENEIVIRPIGVEEFTCFIKWFEQREKIQ